MVDFLKYIYIYIYIYLAQWVNGGFREVVIGPMYGCLCTSLTEGSGHHVVHFLFSLILGHALGM